MNSQIHEDVQNPSGYREGGSDKRCRSPKQEYRARGEKAGREAIPMKTKKQGCEKRASEPRWLQDRSCPGSGTAGGMCAAEARED